MPPKFSRASVSPERRQPSEGGRLRSPSRQGVPIFVRRGASKAAASMMMSAGSCRNGGSIGRRRFLVLSAAVFALHGNQGVAAEEEDEEDGDEGLLQSPCEKDCMPKCFNNFGAALVPGNRADVEVYCRSRCVFNCDGAQEAQGSWGGDPLLNASKGTGKRVGGERKYCKQGKKATMGVETGVYKGMGLEFYGCD
eukprot:CAMPEP_0173455160 /NCGR_PEP_ID=MMETSP1357-20121228/53756_1 /TAXON_ID=77926 /ORGANISM="Hemiselmis rufescens, Strain PCC563" /LENGTH=194 /DNA_ID=CAMNT_0014422261 /DNA_START=1 /DNA_END=585 /DNA_ORIENTATION=+